MENKEKVFTNLEVELVQMLSELGMAPESHRDFGWLKEVILMAVDNSLDWEEQYAEYIGRREKITRESVRQILYKAVWNHWNVNSENILQKHLEIVQVKFERTRPDHVEFIRLISDNLRKKYQVLL